MKEDALQYVGNAVPGWMQRDAVHIALAPMTLTGKATVDQLKPGTRVGIDKDGNACPHTEPHVGVIDPFLGYSYPGMYVFVFLYPNTVKGMRHEWTHPAFDKPDAEKSKKWLREFAEKSGAPDYAVLMTAATGQPPKRLYANSDEMSGKYSNDGEYLTFYGNDAHGEIPAEFWDHVEVVSGKKIPEDLRAKFFSCSC